MIEKISELTFPQINIDSSEKKNVSENINFGDYVKTALDRVNQSQINSENETVKLVSGDAKDIHGVLLATEEARLSLELASQIRNKLVDAYQELSRMPI